MDLAALLKSTGTAAYAVSSQGKIVGWNDQAERLLGFKASRVMGQSCARVLAGTDLFGNCFCGSSCPVLRMVARHKPVHDFECFVRDFWGRRICARVFIFVVSGQSAPGPNIVHLLNPAPHSDRTLDNPNLASADPASSDEENPPSRQPLTKREVQILQRIRKGETTQSVADELFISPKTVRNHIQNIYEKLGVHNRLEAVFVARRDALI